MTPFEIMDLIREAVDAEREKHVRVIRILERLIDEGLARNRELHAVIDTAREGIAALRHDATHLREELAKARPLWDAINRAASEMPDDYEIHISIERGAASVYLLRPDSKMIPMDVDADDRLAAEINAAVDLSLPAKGAG